MSNIVENEVITMSSRIIAIKVEAPGTHEQHITHFKLDTNNVMEKIAMILYVQMSPDTFYTNEDNRTAYLEIATSANGTRYVKTKPDSTTKNNLLSLPRF
jgi:hypothetical protein